MSDKEIDAWIDLRRKVILAQSGIAHIIFAKHLSAVVAIHPDAEFYYLTPPDCQIAFNYPAPVCMAKLENGIATRTDFDSAPVHTKMVGEYSVDNFDRVVMCAGYMAAAGKGLIYVEMRHGGFDDDGIHPSCFLEMLYCNGEIFTDTMDEGVNEQDVRARADNIVDWIDALII